MTVIRGFMIVLAGTLGFAALGGGVGYGLGVLLPEYYRGVFHAAGHPHFSPTAVGLGLGLTQGAIAGLVVGCVVVVTVGWYRSQMSGSGKAGRASESTRGDGEA
ncbi:MAG: hypothetical protein SFX72_06095 [Isosphaeraceae bacterium]|nr:hypothetical protein [Isosphaeraceae bacterium]